MQRRHQRGPHTRPTPLPGSKAGSPSGAAAPEALGALVGQVAGVTPNGVRDAAVAVPGNVGVDEVHKMGGESEPVRW